MAKLGRPSTYRPEYADRAIQLGSEGASKAMIAAELCGGSYDQLDDWSKANPAFREAMIRARTLALAWFESAGRLGMANREFNSNLYRVVMAGRFPAEYRDSKVIEHIAAPTNLDLGKLSPDERGALATLLGKARATPDATPAEPLPVTLPDDPSAIAKPLDRQLN